MRDSRGSGVFAFAKSADPAHVERLLAEGHKDNVTGYGGFLRAALATVHRTATIGHDVSVQLPAIRFNWVEVPRWELGYEAGEPVMRAGHGCSPLALRPARPQAGIDQIGHKPRR